MPAVTLQPVDVEQLEEDVRVPASLLDAVEWMKRGFADGLAGTPLRNAPDAPVGTPLPEYFTDPWWFYTRGLALTGSACQPLLVPVTAPEDATCPA